MKNTVMISFDNISKSYGSKVLFDNITFNINKGEHIGLVGRNGHGKTTLMKIITGEESADSGKVSIPKNYKIGFLNQNIKFNKSTIIEEAMLGLSEEEQHDKWRAEKTLFGLGFKEEDMQKSPLSFSGGFQVRLMLAQTLLSQPNMLLLDEPTNYLDIISLRWLKNFLNTWKGELLLITHDRQFMDDIVTHIVGIHRTKIRKMEGKTDKFYEQIAKDEEIYEKTRINDEQKRKDLEQYITRFRAKARLAGLVQSRVKTLNKMEKKEKLEVLKNLEFSFKYKPIVSKQIMRAENISFSYSDNKLLINDLSIIIGSEDKIAVIGKNGKGKSTLLKVLAGELKATSGNVIYHNGCIKGYYEQTNISTLNPDNTIEEEIQAVSDEFDRTYVRNICGAMLFEQDMALKKIKVLSGGEKSRVMLGKIIAKPQNVLILDEPTNHLDMEACDSLIEAIDNFPGAVIMVTHNEMFLYALANRLIVFQKEYPYIFEGSYKEFLEKEGWQEENISKTKEVKTKLNKKDTRKIRSEIITEKNTVLKPIEKNIEKLENDINNYELEIKEINNLLIKASSENNGILIGEYGKKLHNINQLIDNAFNELDIAFTLLEEKKQEYENKLKQIEE